jgi:hypothetical protein
MDLAMKLTTSEILTTSNHIFDSFEYGLPRYNGEMSLWIFQVIVDILLINMALLWLLSRKQIRFLMAQVDRLDHEILNLRNGKSAAPNPRTDEVVARFETGPSVFEPHVSPQLNLEKTQLPTSLVEKSQQLPLSKSDPAEAFDRASALLARGVNVKEISKLTGLSFAELQLMNKFVSRNQ